MKGIPDTVFHSRYLSCKTPYGAVPAGSSVTFRMFLPQAEELGAVALWVIEDGHDDAPQSIPMSLTGLTDGRLKYVGTYTPPYPGLYWYYFTISRGGALSYVSRGYGGRSELLGQPGDRYQLTVYDAAYHPPRWFGEGITYSIFPDRFHRHQLPIQPEGEGIAPRVLHEEWAGLPVYQPDENGEIHNHDFFGGTLRGILEKLDYLESLHVQTIYLNPVFQAYSNHRYDTGDYLKIDPLLGTEADFEELCRETARRGMRIILDGVFSHTGSDSRYFNACGRYDGAGAYQSQESPFYPWYDFQRWPDRYRCWWNFHTLPEVNEMDESYQQFILEGEDSVVRRWLRRGAAGWRLDVADELPDAFIRRLNSAVKEEKPDALIIGEVWEDASHKTSYSKRRSYLQGGELDSVMNYPLRNAIFSFLSGGTAEHFAETIECIRENYPKEVFYNLMNIIGTHDTVRALTLLGVSEEKSRRLSHDERALYQMSPEELESAKRRLKLAAVIQFTLPGSPTIYYGDEAGMQGFEDPLNRCPYPWGKEDRELLAFYRHLGGIRATNALLIHGSLRFLDTAGALLQYERADGEDRMIILVNRSHQELAVRTDAAFATDLLSGQSFRYMDASGLTLSVPPETAYILRCFGAPWKGKFKWI